MLQQFDDNFGHFDNKFCNKIDKSNYNFSNEIADCCSIRLATLPQKESAIEFSQKMFIRKFGIVTDCDAQVHGFESRQS